MLKRVALLGPCALIVAASACGGESLSTTGEDEQFPPQAENRGGEMQGGEGRGGEFQGNEGRGNEGRGGEFHGGEGRGRGHRHGRVDGRWAPGWGWSNGIWIEGGTGQYPCVSDNDCAGPLGPSVAICDFNPTVGLGQCVSPSW